MRCSLAFSTIELSELSTSPYSRCMSCHRNDSFPYPRRRTAQRRSPCLSDWRHSDITWLPAINARYLARGLMNRLALSVLHYLLLITRHKSSQSAKAHSQQYKDPSSSVAEIDINYHDRVIYVLSYYHLSVTDHNMWNKVLTPVKVLMLWRAFWASRAAFRV